MEIRQHFEESEYGNRGDFPDYPDSGTKKVRETADGRSTPDTESILQTAGCAFDGYAAVCALYGESRDICTAEPGLFRRTGTDRADISFRTFVIGYEGEIVQCIPLNEMAYAVIGENDHSISIECCYLDQDGKFTDATYQSLLKLLGWLMEEYNLDVSDVKRHYDAGGKLCPLYYAEHEDAWEQLKQDLSDYISGEKV